MNDLAAISIICFLGLANIGQIFLSADSSATIIAAIEDNGCASYQPPAPEHKTNIEAYNLDSLKGNK